jgi:hypothetical protein
MLACDQCARANLVFRTDETQVLAANTVMGTRLRNIDAL